MSDTAYRLILSVLDVSEGLSTKEMAQAVQFCLPNANPQLITAALQATAGKRVTTQAQAVWCALRTGSLPSKPTPQFRICGSVPMQRGKPIAPTMAKPVRIRTPPRPPPAMNEARQARHEAVRELVGQGLSQRQIAAALGISQSAVKADLQAMNLATTARHGRRAKVQEEAAGA